MDKILKTLQIINQVVWIGVGLATIYSIYFFISHNPIEEIMKKIPQGTIFDQSILQSTSNPNLETNIQNNPQIQKIIQQNLRNSK